MLSSAASIGVLMAAKAYQWFRFMYTYSPLCLTTHFAFIYEVHSICLQIQADYVTFLFEKRFLQKECKEHSIVGISTVMIINKIVLVVHWCYWPFSHVSKFYWIYCLLKWMLDQAKEFTMRANQSCFDEFEFRKMLMKVLRLYWMFTIMRISLLKVYFAQLNANWCKWTHFCIIVWLLVQMIVCFP